MDSKISPIADERAEPDGIDPRPDRRIAVDAFRPNRGSGAGVYAVLAVLAAAGGWALHLGYVPLERLGDYAFWAVPTAVAATALFAILSAWALGRRGDTSGEAALLHLAQGEDGDALMITDAQGRIVYANAAFRTLFKDEASPEIPAALDLAAGQNGTDAVLRLQAAALSGARDRDDVAFTGRSGWEWWRLEVRPLIGRAGFGVWSARDVTARRELDDVRQREEALLSDMLDNLPVGFFSVDGSGKLIYVNRPLGLWLGLELSDLRDRDVFFSDFVIASGASAAAGAAEQSDAEADDGLHGEVTLQGRGGVTFKALLLQSGRVGDDGELIYSRSVVVRDVAHRQPASDGYQDVDELAGRLHWLFDEAPVAIALLDLHGNLTDCNRAFLRTLGRHKDDVLARPFADHLAKEDRSDVASQLSKVVMGILRAAHIEVRLPAPGGREVTASLYASRMEDNFGEVTGLVLHFIDTTEQKHLEVQFNQSQKMQAIGQLAGGIAHDFNNLLTAMIGFSDLLLSRHGPDDPSFSDIQQIKQNANRATNLVRQLLAFSRKQTLEPVELEPTEALGELSNLLSRLLGPQIELQMEHERDLGSIRVDRGQFDQVIINLAVNARDAMPGGGTLTIRTQNRHHAEDMQRGMELVAAGDYVTIDIQDTGVGISKEDLGRIFDPFFTTKEVGEGTGLGLSTVYGIVHQTGGYVFVDSAPGEGTTFTIYLPRLTESLDRPLTPETKALAAAQGKLTGPTGPATEEDLTGAGTILFVEDEDAVRMFGTRALTNKGYDVLEACNGEEALDVINATDKTIDLIVTDVVMPGMDGHTLVQFVRQELPAVKVILISGYADNVIPGGVQPDRDFAFLPKPFSLKDLAGKVKSVLEG